MIPVHQFVRGLNEIILNIPGGKMVVMMIVMMVVTMVVIMMMMVVVIMTLMATIMVRIKMPIVRCRKSAVCLWRESVEWIGQESSGGGCFCFCFCSAFGFVLSLRMSVIQATAQTALLIMPTPCPSCPPALPHGHMWLDILTSSFVLITRTRAESKKETALSLEKPSESPTYCSLVQLSTQT